MDRNSLVRAVVSTFGGAALGYAVANACAWICTAASLGAFMSFLTALLAIIVMALGAHVVSGLVTKHITNERIDGAVSWLSALRAKVAA